MCNCDRSSAFESSVHPRPATLVCRRADVRGQRSIDTRSLHRGRGIGILSSAAEVKHAIEDDGVERLPFNAAAAMQHPYEIDKLQPTYFVLDDFRQLFEAAQIRIA